MMTCVTSIICVASFSKNGKLKEEELKKIFPEIIWISNSSFSNLEDFIKNAFLKKLPILFISSCGIAVRKISPFVKDKFLDSPVLVMDEKSKFIIPILSCHLGGANKIAKKLSQKLLSVPVITTATDIQEKFSIDLFAKNNALKILNRNGIKKISSKILNNEIVNIWINEKINYSKKDVPKCFKIISFNELSDFENLKTDVIIDFTLEKQNCILQLCPKLYCVGIGCKKNKSFEELYDFLKITFDKNNLQLEDIKSISSIDLKQNELGLLILSQFLNVPFYVFSSEELNNVKGNFAESDFVKKTTGVSNVCERAAKLSSGKDGKIILKKTSFNGITLALAKQESINLTWSDK